MLKRLIVNADDYGHTSGISLGIRQAHLNGIVTSTSVMMNRPDAVNAIKLARKECPKLGLGLHLVITTGRPVLPISQVISLLDEEGKFHRPQAFLDKLSDISLMEVELEWRAQIAAFQACAVCNPDHLDSHHHSSYFSDNLFALMLTLSKELSCPIRLPIGVDQTIFAGQSAENYKKLSTTQAPQVFFSSFYDQGATFENLTNIIQTIATDPKHSTFELMCHPAVMDDELYQTTTYNDQRTQELALLQDREIRLLLEHHAIQLICFADLNKKRI